MVLVCGDVWGTERFATNYMPFDGAPGALGGTALAVWITQAVYNANAGADGRCYGPSCFLFTYLLTAGLQLVGVVLVVRLSLQCRSVYATMKEGAVSTLSSAALDENALSPQPSS